MSFQHTRLDSLLQVLVFPLLAAILAASQPACRIPLGSVLSADGNSPPWLSPSREFAFGFRSLPHPSSNNEDQYLLAIWYDQIPEQTIVWSMNAHPVPKGSRIQLTDEGHLVLSRDSREIWRAEIGNQRSSCAAMLDSGNFVLINTDSDYLWESFSIPTDTILPGQSLGMGGNLTSRQSETNFSDGRFQLRLQHDGNLVLYTIFLPTEVVNSAYWASATVNSSSNSSLVFDEAGYIYIREGSKNKYNVTRKNLGSARDFYYMARLDPDGVFRHYNHLKRNSVVEVGRCTSSWSPVQTTPEDICSAVFGDLGSGACGYNSYCVSSNGKPSCFCPEGYSFLDSLNTYRGCRPDFQWPSCQQDGWESNTELVEFKELNNTDWPLTDYELQTGANVDKDACKEFCLRDCFCAAAIYNGNRCWKKKFPLSNGRQTKEVNRIALLKVPRSNVTKSSNSNVRKDQSRLVIALSALLGSSVFLNLLLLIAIAIATFLVYHKKLMYLQSGPTVLYGVRMYSYKELEEASGGFKEHLGRGSFGTVYKGVLPSDRRRYVAIKRLDRVEKEGEREFITEVNAIGQTHHKNLVTLLGFCNEGQHRVLVYEYMSNGSLASHLFGLTRPRWNQRMQIANGIARGLTYLHEECGTQIIHCDVKPQNILLDEFLMPKISDFGMAKLLLSEQSRAARTHIRGTIGYFAPEWFRKASISVKVDVYSFGAMLLEIICCMSSVKFGLGDEEEDFIDWAYECYNERTLNKLVENDEEAKNDMKNVERLVMVAIWCVQEDPTLRPSMRRVSQMLEGVAHVSIPPRPLPYNSSSTRSNSTYS